MRDLSKQTCNNNLANRFEKTKTMELPETRVLTTEANKIFNTHTQQNG